MRGAARTLKARTLLMTAYASGLRLSELCALRGCDIDSAPDCMCIRVVLGKGNRDRYSLLTADLLEHAKAFACQRNAANQEMHLHGWRRQTTNPRSKAAHLVLHNPSPSRTRKSSPNDGARGSGAAEAVHFPALSASSFQYLRAAAATPTARPVSVIG
ncbi:MAG TPA: tyrosine-type recombinase/integrase [Casimicrobiaceae bacterium]|jgi:integrase|nr:tyrosine-type recombinase/integrase [Casimicrobiaceae bacterium]